MARSCGTASPGCPFQAARHFFLSLGGNVPLWTSGVAGSGSLTRPDQEARLLRRVTYQARRRRTGIFRFSLVGWQ